MLATEVAAAWSDVVSVLLFPVLALRVRRGRRESASGSSAL